ncbi:N-alpha-acetyltransferase 38, NatC auxiliary subunit [Cotesia glomerata]|uniref:Sm domain-containing protein n=1 Tax=Cotesia glomerata TaxID=32391 RepID=A0AAV7I5T3_COTGL|nr:N-alpha-acetyltransferase 38, NatC auxiliary subunit [Cotesia glomerata]XP_044581080.1 N-alpha-acetyltransferase 38, NatC auxiliary subunit [Cotesia glomerata]KAH0553997.1 hypothetical protein KQX54_006897 [Cotesia glomerata]
MKDSTNNSSEMENKSVQGNGETSPNEEPGAKQKLRSWLNRYLRVKITDGRVLTGAFLCTDRDANVILGCCEEFLSEEHTEPRALGLVMVPRRHIVSIHISDWHSEDVLSTKKRCSSNSE